MIPRAPIAIPYFTGHGHTKVLAQEVAHGAEAAGGAATLIDVERMTSAEWQHLHAAPAILFACPTYMGSVPARFEAFLEEASEGWVDQVWANKIAGGLTVATFPAGDKLATLMRLSVYAAQMGMIWIGQQEIGAPVRHDHPGINAGGSWLGLTASSSRNKSQMVESCDLETARRYGARIAMAVVRWG
ncbi:flavodoxin family protein [Roseovarius sp. E0-M6]|uniref:flavodoxin family protein n=1 Tax=Roseovarius sp. E0-M6 TaxID=3127118 RepID=UPI00301051B4